MGFVMDFLGLKFERFGVCRFGCYMRSCGGDGDDLGSPPAEVVSEENDD